MCVPKSFYVYVYFYLQSNILHSTAQHQTLPRNLLNSLFIFHTPYIKPFSLSQLITTS